MYDVCACVCAACTPPPSRPFPFFSLATPYFLKWNGNRTRGSSRPPQRPLRLRHLPAVPEHVLGRCDGPRQRTFRGGTYFSRPTCSTTSFTYFYYVSSLLYCRSPPPLGVNYHPSQEDSTIYCGVIGHDRALDRGYALLTNDAWGYSEVSVSCACVCGCVFVCMFVPTASAIAGILSRVSLGLEMWGVAVLAEAEVVA